MTISFITGPARTITRFGEPAHFREGLYQLNTQTYAWMVPNGSWGETNLGLIDCGGQSVLIDTCWDVSLTQEVLGFVATIIQQSPIEYVINTHADGDHCWGNQLFKDKAIIATQACIHHMHHQPPAILQAVKHSVKLLRHIPVAGIDHFGHYMHHMFQPYCFNNIHVTAPNVGFAIEKTMSIKGIDIVIREVGPGHSEGDCIVYVPSQRVVYAGDILFVGVTPVAWAGPIDNIVSALQQLLQLDVDVIVPGHGPLATRQDVQRVIEYWDFVQAGLFKRFQQGMSPIVATQDFMLSPVFQQSEYSHWDSPERLLTNAYTLYRQWGVKPSKLPGKLRIMNQLRQQAILGSKLPTTASPHVMHQA